MKIRYQQASVLAAVGIALVLLLVLRSRGDRRGIEEIRTVPAEQVADLRDAELPDELPDYAALFDAKVTGRAENDGYVRVTMETINGMRSPFVFYSSTLAEAGWTIGRQVENDMDAVIQASGGGRTVEVKLTALPDGNGTVIEVIAKK